MKNKKNNIFDKKEIKKVHGTFHDFQDFLRKKFGKGCWSWKPDSFTKKKWRCFDEIKFSKNLTGYKVMTTIEEYVKKHPQIKIVRCDDSAYAGSDIVLIPHPKHGIRVMFFPQCTPIQNEFFLYGSDFQNLITALIKMSKTGVYSAEDKEEKQFIKKLKIQK